MEWFGGLLILIVILLIAIMKSPEYKGKYGEKRIKKLLNKYYKKDKLLVINDLRFYNNKQMSVQVDHIIMSSNKIICIETKNYSGKIYGAISKETWYKYYETKNKNKQKYEFYNPIMQNQNHIKYILEKTNLKIEISNIVVDIGSADYKTKYKEIFYYYEFRKWLKSNCLEITENDRVHFDRIKAIHQNISNKEHIKNINSKY